MIFWDSSAILPLVIQEPRSSTVRACFSTVTQLLWWSTPLECESAVCRRVREGSISAAEAKDVRHELEALRLGMIEVLPSQEVRLLAVDMLRKHPLRAADAAQLGAAEMWRRRSGQALSFVCLDQRLRDAAASEGFTLLP